MPRLSFGLLENRRPRIKVPRSQFEVFLELVSLLGLGATAYLLQRHWPDLPATIPTHFGGSGAPDGWGPKAAIFLPAAVAAGIYLLLTIVSFYPHRLNYLWEITEENAERQYAIARTMLTGLKCGMIWIFTYILWSTIRVALGRGEGLGKAFLPAMVGITFGIVILGLYQAWKNR